MPAGPLDPDRLATTEFATSFRGYDTAEVRALLVTVSEALREAADREHDLRDQLARAEDHLREAREAAAAQAEEAAEEGRRQGREMVAEAQRVRERMLGDLARRRRHARQQVEQLMAGRERLLEAFDTVRQTIDAATHEMRTSLPEARSAAEAAGRRFDHEGDEEPDEAVATLEGEIQAARIAGLPIVEPGPTPPDEVGGGSARSGEGPGRRGEASLLGERDVRDMPPVELGAEFEDVRIVPLENADGAAAPDADADEVEVDEVEGEVDEGEVEGEVDEVEGEVDEVEGEVDEVEGEVEVDEVEGAAGDGGEPAVEDPGADERLGADADPGPPDVEHLDDLFASLRAARAEAVVEARTVLARGEEAPPDEPVAPAEEMAQEPVPTSAEDVEQAPAVGDSPAAPEPPVEPVEVEAVVAGAADHLASALKRVLADEQNELLERLRELRTHESAADAPVLGDGASLAARFARAAADPLAAAAARGLAAGRPGGRGRPPAAVPMADAVGATLVEPLHQRLSRGLAEAGTDHEEASRRVRATFREWKTQRIAAVSADAARGAYHAGLLAGVAKGRTLRWVLDDADAACPECADNALAGAVVRGDAYPTGHRHPPAHDGCRCTLRPEADPEQERAT